MKTIIQFLVIFLTQNCNPKATTIEPQAKLPAKILEVYFQKWIGGQQQMGSGTDFHIQFQTAFPKGVELKKVYFQNQEADFEVQDATNFMARLLQKPKSDIILDADSKKEYGNKAHKIIKPKYVLILDEAILQFTQKGKVVDIKVGNIKQKEVVAYPSGKPAME